MKVTVIIASINRKLMTIGAKKMEVDFNGGTIWNTCMNTIKQEEMLIYIRLHIDFQKKINRVMILIYWH